MSWFGNGRDVIEPREIKPPFWVRSLEVFALAKLGFACLGLANVGTVVSPYQAVFFTLHILAYGGVGLLLRYLGRQDQRAVSLGLGFLLLATVWSDRLLYALAQLSTVLTTPALILRETAVVSFVPYFLWMFVLDFPRPTLRTEARGAGIAAGGALALGWILFVANLALLLPLEGPWASLVQILDRGRFDGWFWPAVILSSLAAVPFAVSQMARAPADEQRRVRIVLASLFIGLAPQLLLTLLLSVSPALLQYQQSPTGELVTDMMVYPGELAMPGLIMYAVLVHRALDLRLLVRKALEYAMARQTLAALVATPFVAMTLLIYAHQDQPIGALLTGPSGIVVLIILLSGLSLTRLRPRLLLALDRRFFREQYDARRILGGITTVARGARDSDHLASTLIEHVDKALHLQSLGALFFDPVGDCYFPTSAAGSVLPADSVLARRLRDAGEPIEIEWSRPGFAHQLPPAEQAWLVDADARLLVPIVDGEESLLGMLALGEKRSGLPFTAEDRLLLTALTDSIAAAVRRTLPGAASVPRAGAEADDAARECLTCGQLTEATVRRCAGCDHSTVEADVPLVLAGKFRIVERLGQGGMGVVYRGVDTQLDRPVAIKTLPSVASVGAAHLRREARSMAAVAHPHLAVIYGAESWHGVPMLVMEFLGGGTLADRIGSEPMAAADALRLGRQLASALEALHAASLIHGDVKPSNIGFTAGGRAKLLDFGLSRVAFGSVGDAEALSWRSHRALTLTGSGGPAGYARTSALVGTPLYFSPEQIRGRKPDTSTDLWALALVLYEAVAGQHPFKDCSLDEIFHRLSETRVPEIRTLRPDVPEPLARMLYSALDPDPGRRPRSASEMLVAINRAAGGLASVERLSEEPIRT